MGRELSRRSFLTGSLALGTTAAAAGILASCASDGAGDTGSAAADSRTWDQEADVVVVGTGFAGLAAGYSAAQAGANVLIIEKAPEEDAGGNSRVCAQAIWCPQETEGSINYFKEITGEYHMADIDDSVVTAYIEKSKDNATWMEEEFSIDAKKYTVTEYAVAKTAPEIGKDNAITPTEGLGNAKFWDAMYEVVSTTDGITIAFETALSDLVFNDAGDVIGVEADQGGKTVALKAKRGVVLCSGGFEFDPVMLSEYTRYPSLAWGTPYNTGDAQKICAKYDIAFWHMNSATPLTRLGVQVSFLGDKYTECGFDCEISGDFGYLWTDKYGQRFMNESRYYQHGFGRNAIFYNDGNKMEWPRVPLWQVCDESALAFMGTVECGWTYIVGQTQAAKEVEKLMEAGLLKKADTVEDLANQMGVDPATLQATVDAYQATVSAGAPDAFGRDPEKMRAFSGPLYAIQLYPIMVNTNGGPKRDANANILRNDATPINRLYSSGELGSIWSWYYQGAGNVAECISVGRIAGENVAALTAWDE